jgi:hypothetical protein
LELVEVEVGVVEVFACDDVAGLNGVGVVVVVEVGDGIHVRFVDVWCWDR